MPSPSSVHGGNKILLVLTHREEGDEGIQGPDLGPSQVDPILKGARWASGLGHSGSGRLDMNHFFRRSGWFRVKFMLVLTQPAGKSPPAADALTSSTATMCHTATTSAESGLGIVICFHRCAHKDWIYTVNGVD